MFRLRAIFALLLLLTNLVFISAFDWTFWSDDDDSESTSGSASLSEAPTTISSTTDSSIDSSPQTNYTLVKVSDAESTITSTYRNWTSDPQASQDKILTLLYQTNNVVTDLPMAIYTCMGLDVPTSLDISGRVLTTFEWILMNVIAYDDDIVSSWDKFKAFLTGANFTEAASSINDTEIATLSDALASNSTCGFDLKSLTDRTWMTVAQLRKDNPEALRQNEPTI
eukprot:jgi/Phyca11/15708/fgenesh1_pg.PHYCAscaffold_15_\